MAVRREKDGRRSGTEKGDLQVKKRGGYLEISVLLFNRRREKEAGTLILG